MRQPGMCDFLGAPAVPTDLIDWQAGIMAGGTMARILIIDDNAEHRVIFGRFIEYAGHQAIGVATAVAGLTYTRQQLPDVVVLDLRLPDLDGWTVASRLRSNPRTQQIPVVITTAEPLTRQQIAAPATEYDTILLKPFDMVTFLAVIERLLAPQHRDRGPAPGEMPLQRCVGTRCEMPPDQLSS
jgi:CheY-like chemotaxis protein